MVPRLLSTLAALLALATSVSADEIVRERLSFRPGTVSTAVTDSIRGYEVHDYVIGARAGQMMTVSFDSANEAASFNVTADGSDSAIFIGEIGGTEFSEVLPSGGDWVVRVGMMRAAARRGEVADYRLRVTVTGGATTARPEPDFADGLAGGRIPGACRGFPRAISSTSAPNPPRERASSPACRMAPGS